MAAALDLGYLRLGDADRSGDRRLTQPVRHPGRMDLAAKIQQAAPRPLACSIDRTFHSWHTTILGIEPHLAVVWGPGPLSLREMNSGESATTAST